MSAAARVSVAVRIPVTARAFALATALGGLAGGPAAQAQVDPPPNSPPVLVEPFADRQVTEGAPFTLDAAGHFEDADPGDVLTFSVSGQPPGLALAGSVLSGAPEPGSAGGYEVTITASDSAFDSASGSFTLTVTAPANRPPVQTAALPPQSAAEGEPVEFDLRPFFDDPDGDDLAFAASGLPPGLAVSANGVLTGTLSQTAAGGSPYAVSLAVTDGRNEPLESGFTFIVEEVNLPPSAGPLPDRTFTEGDPANFNVAGAFSDPDGDPLTFSQTGLPAGLSLAAGGPAAGMVSGTVAAGTAAGSPYTVTITASDGALTGSSTFTIAVEAPAPPENQPPVLTSAIPDQSFTEGGTVTLALANHFSDPDGDDLSYAAPGLPPGLSLSAEGGIAGTVAAGAAAGSPYTIDVTASDGVASATDQFIIHVSAAANQPPEQISALPSPTFSVGTPVNLDLSGHFADPDGDALSFAAAGLPPALALSPAGRLTGTPPPGALANSPYSVSLTVSDGTEQIAATLVIAITAANRAPELVSPLPSPQYTEGQAVSLDVSGHFSDPDGDPLTFSATGLPGGLAISAAGRMSGTLAPGAASGSPFAVTVSASDGSASASGTLTIGVTAANQPPSLPSVPTLTTPEDTPLTITAQRLGVVDDDLSRVVIEVSAPPPGANYSVEGTVVRPAPDFHGTISIEVRISDQSHSLPPVQVPITVTPVNDAPRIAPIPPQSLTPLVPFTLALGDFVTDVENDPLTFSVEGLPPGLTFDAAGATIGGTVPLDTPSGTYEATLTVSDGSASASATIPFSLLGADEADLEALMAVEPRPALVGEAVTWTATVRNLATIDVGNLEFVVVFSGSAAAQIDAAPDPACASERRGNDTVVTCSWAPLVGGGSRDVVLTGRGTQAGSVLAVTSVSITDVLPVDRVESNDTASVVLNVTERLSSGPSQQLTAPGARAVAAADFDGNGTVDLAVATAAGEPTLVFLNLPGDDASTLAFSSIPLSAGDVSGAHDIAAADLDGDGDVDLVVAGAEGGSLLLVNEGAASFQPMPVGPADTPARAVTVADLDGDGLPDIVFAADGPNTVWRNAGALQFEAVAIDAEASPAASLDVIAADLFGDAQLELVFANATGDATVYTRGAAGYELALTLPTGATTSVTAADFNADGRIDLVFGRSSGGAPSLTSDLVLLNTSSASPAFFLDEQLGSATTVDILAADFDIDGLADIVTIGAAGSHQFYRNAGAANTAFLLHPEQFATGAAFGAVHAKLNPDERDDIAVAAGDAVAIFLNDGSGNFGAGDTGAPTITLNGPPSVTLTVGDPYEDAGATAQDALDGDLSGQIVVSNPVDTQVIGTYTVTYDVTDSSGNAAPTVTRTVEVRAREAQGGGGGGAVSWEWLLLALVLAILLHERIERGPRRPPRV